MLTWRNPSERPLCARGGGGGAGARRSECLLGADSVPKHLSSTHVPRQHVTVQLSTPRYLQMAGFWHLPTCAVYMGEGTRSQSPHQAHPGASPHGGSCSPAAGVSPWCAARGPGSAPGVLQPVRGPKRRILPRGRLPCGWGWGGLAPQARAPLGRRQCVRSARGWPEAHGSCPGRRSGPSPRRGSGRGTERGSCLRDSHSSGLRGRRLPCRLGE